MLHRVSAVGGWVGSTRIWVSYFYSVFGEVSIRGSGSFTRWPQIWKCWQCWQGLGSFRVAVSPSCPGMLPA